jgi:hypothetical protein
LIPNGAARQLWLNTLWATPWILIVCFIIWHFIAADVGYIQPRLMWALHKRDLVAAYSKVSEANQRRDINGYFIAAGMANAAIDRLTTDLQALSGAPDHA